MAITNEGEYKVLASKIVEKAAQDLRTAIKRDIRKGYFSARTSKDERLSTKAILTFFSSPFCDLCCGTIDPWYICRLLLEEQLGNPKLPLGYDTEYEAWFKEEKNRQLIDIK